MVTMTKPASFSSAHAVAADVSAVPTPLPRRSAATHKADMRTASWTRIGDNGARMRWTTPAISSSRSPTISRPSGPAEAPATARAARVSREADGAHGCRDEVDVSGDLVVEKSDDQPLVGVGGGPGDRGDRLL